MSGVIEVRIRIDRDKLGKLVEDMATHLSYAEVVGVTLIVPGNQKMLPAPAHEKRAYKKRTPAVIDHQNLFLSEAQAKMLEAIKNGATDDETIANICGYVGKPWVTKRVANTLIRKKLVTYVNGVYVLGR